MKKCMDFSGSDALKKKSRIPQKTSYQGRSQPLVAERAGDFHGRAKKFKRKG
jgi:hypothetical protein